ncbi:MAG: hypothetical protein U0610_03615 [bacterium]
MSAGIAWRVFAVIRHPTIETALASASQPPLHPHAASRMREVDPGDLAVRRDRARIAPPDARLSEHLAPRATGTSPMSVRTIG